MKSLYLIMVVLFQWSYKTEDVGLVTKFEIWDTQSNSLYKVVDLSELTKITNTTNTIFRFRDDSIKREGFREFVVKAVANGGISEPSEKAAFFVSEKKVRECANCK